MGAKSLPFGIKILIAVMVIISLASIGVIVAYEYFNANDWFPETLQTATIGEIEDKDGNKYPFIEVNYYADEKMEGNAMYEVCFNFFTGIDKQEVVGYAMQQVMPMISKNDYANKLKERWNLASEIDRILINEKLQKLVGKEVNPTTGELQNSTGKKLNKIESIETPTISETVRTKGDKIRDDLAEIKIFQRYQGQSWGAMNEMDYGKEADPMIFEIGGETFSLYLDGTYDVSRWVPKGAGDKFLSFWTNFGSWQKDVSVWNNEITETKEYTFEAFFANSRDSLFRNSHGYGDFVLPVVELSNYFSIKQFDEGTAQFLPMPYTTHAASYFKINGHASKNEIMYARQSILGQVNGKADWTYNNEALQDYWQHNFEKNLSLNDFEMRHSEADGGYWLTLPKDLIGEINRAGDFLVNINLNLDATDKKILGFDFYAIDGLSVEKLKISAGVPQDFVFKNSWNANSTVKATEYVGVTVINEEGENNG